MKNDSEIYSTNYIGAIKSLLLIWLQTCLNLLFPLRCGVCGVLIQSTKRGLICGSCHKKIIFIKKPTCTVCGLMFLKSGGESHLCAGCRSNPPYFNQAHSLVRYGKYTSDLVHKLKFSGDLSVLDTFGRWAESSFSQKGGGVDYIVPVPLHPKRIRLRGFNQAALLARVFFPGETSKIKHLLERTENTTPQTELGGVSRRKNLANCFKVVHSNQVRHRVIYVIDDVYTTGTTVNECAKVLMEAGASRVEVYTLAMVVKENN